ncbi:ribose ABC transport system [Cutibacterium acnes JCM 18909]|nr:ribose ABC transport system [Cutibacterium acnes JCM 18909]
MSLMPLQLSLLVEPHCQEVLGRQAALFIGAVLLAVIRNGFNILNVSSFWQQVVIGCVIALAVGFDVFRSKKES